MSKQKTGSSSSDKGKKLKPSPEQFKGSIEEKHPTISRYSNKILILIFIIIEITIIALMYPDFRISRNHALARKYAQNKDYENSKKHYLILKGIYPNSETINLELGNVYYSMNNYKDALDCFLIVLNHQKNPSGELLNLLGLCYINIGNKNKGIELMEQAVKKIPNDPYANFYIGEKNLKNKEFLEAAKYFNRIPNPEMFGEQLTQYWKEIEKAVLGDLAEESN